MKNIYRKLLLSSLVIGLAIAGVLCFFYYSLRNVIRDAYCQEWAAGIVITYIENHNGQWPSSWNDLVEPYNEHVAIVGRSWSLEEIQHRVTVEWNVNVNELIESIRSGNGLKRKYIYLTNGKSMHWSGMEANQIVEGYFRDKYCNSRETQGEHQ